MTTLVMAKKAGQVAMAADTLVIFGDRRVSHRFEGNSKIFKVDAPAGLSYIGMAGTVAHFPFLHKAMAGMNAGCEFDNNAGGPIDVFTLKLKDFQ